LRYKFSATWQFEYRPVGTDSAHLYAPDHGIAVQFQRTQTPCPRNTAVQIQRNDAAIKITPAFVLPDPICGL